MDPYRPAGRLFYLLLSLLLAAAVTRLHAQAAPATTLVQDKIFDASGQPASGTILIAWSQFTTADGRAIAAGSRTVTVGSDGVVSLPLVPNAGSDPASYYKVTIKLDSGQLDEEIWSVPATSPTTISAIRSRIVPAGTAIQVASRAYVDAALAGKATDNTVVHLAGNETITGTKQFTTTIAASSGPRSATQFYLSSTSLDDIVAARRTWTNAAASGFYNGIRSELTASTGGAYAGTQTAFVPLNGQGIMSAKGQLFGIFTYERGLGIGNAGFSNSVTECWGGSADVAPGSIPLCGFGEHDIYQGAVVNGGSVFSATVSGTPSATQLTYSGPTNESVLGERFLLNGNRTYTTGSVASVSGTSVTGSGTSWTSAMVGKYFKLGNADRYVTPCVGDDQPIDGRCYGHWYKIKAVGSATSLTLEANYDGLNLATTGGYAIADGVEISSFDATAKTIAYPSSSYTTSWANGDVIYSPPNHLMALQGPNFVFRPLFKTGRGSINAVDGIRFYNAGAVNMDTGIHFQGLWRTLLRTDSFANGVEGLDLSNTAFSSFALKLNSGGEASGAIVSSTSKQFFDGSGWSFKTTLNANPGVRSAMFIDGSGNSALMIQHTASGVVDLVDANGTKEMEFLHGTPDTVGVDKLCLDLLNQDVCLTRPGAGIALVTAANGLKATGGVLPNVAGSGTVGSATLPFASLYVGAAATNNIRITGTATAARTFTLPDANSNPVVPDTGALHNFLTGISAGGVITKAQPAFGDLGGTIALAQTPLTTRGDLLVANSTPVLARLGVGAAGTVLVGGADPSYSATPTVTSIQTGAGASNNDAVQLGAVGDGVYVAGGAVRVQKGGSDAAVFATATAYVPSLVLDLTSADVGLKRVAGNQIQVTNGGSGYGTLDAASYRINNLAPFYFVTSDFTTAANTNLQTITGLTWTFPANTAITIPFSCTLLYSQAGGAVPDSFGVQDSGVAPTNVAAYGEMFTGTAAATGGALVGLNTSTATAVVTATPSATATVYPVTLAGVIEHPANASSSAFNIMVKTSNSADAITIKRGSFCKLGPK